MSEPSQGGPQRRPLPTPPNPLETPGPQAAALAALSEQVAQQLEQAAAADAAAREQLASLPTSAQGSALDGGVEVRVDHKGMLVSARYGPELAGATPDELREATLEALGEARGQLRRPHPSEVGDAPLQRRAFADAVLALIGEEPKR